MSCIIESTHIKFVRSDLFGTKTGYQPQAFRTRTWRKQRCVQSFPSTSLSYNSDFVSDLVEQGKPHSPKTPGADQVIRFGAALSNNRCHSNKSPFTFSQKCSFLFLSCKVLVRIYVVGQSLAKDETRQNRKKRLITQAAFRPSWAWGYIHLNLCGDGMRGWVGMYYCKHHQR